MPLALVVRVVEVLAIEVADDGNMLADVDESDVVSVGGTPDAEVVLDKVAMVAMGAAGDPVAVQDTRTTTNADAPEYDTVVVKF